MEDLLRTPVYHTLRTNQMGYIKVKAQLPGIYGNVNRPCPRVAPSDSGRFTAINPWRLGYYLSTLAVPIIDIVVYGVLLDLDKACTD